MRTPAAKVKPRIAKTASFPAPVGGWIKNENLAAPDARRPDGTKVNGAAMLENWFPTATGIRMRGGSAMHSVVGDGLLPVTALFTYVNGNNKSLFAATETDIYDVTASSETLFLTDDDGAFITDDDDNTITLGSVASVDVGPFTGGDWSAVQFATDGGVFLDLVNGLDDKLVYDGTTFYPINGEALNALAYDAQTANFTVGDTLTGGTSGATATIVKVVDAGATGTIWIRTVTGGPFQDNEAITDGGGGAATVNGTITVLQGALTGVETSALSQNWVYKQRIFYIQKDSLTAWYLAADSISGTAVELPLGSVFTLGGSLLFGSSWSLETGASGLSVQCVFVTTEGEAAVYQGDDPSTAATWSLVGVYRLGKPLGPNSFIRAGGDIVVATDIGMVPLSVAVQRDYAALSPSAISYPIETAWNDAVAQRTGNWKCEVWPTKQMMLIGIPSVAGLPSEVFVANTRTGAWAPFTGWDVNCLAAFDSRLFFGSTDGRIMEAEKTGSDDGTPYTSTCIPLFETLKTPASLKVGMMARAMIRAPQQVDVRLSFQRDYAINLPPVPDDITTTGSDLWGTAVWGSSKWGTAQTQQTFQQWKSMPGSGYAVAPAVQITSGNLTAPNVELVQTDMTYDLADIVS